jgi:hypothetical protein
MKHIAFINVFFVKRKLFFVLGILLVICSAFQYLLPPPMDMWTNTGAPGKPTCGSCHSEQQDNSGTGYLAITTVPVMAGNKYIPGTHYTINITVSQPADSAFAVATAVIDSTGNNTGTLVITDSVSTYIETSTSGKLTVSGTASGNSDTYTCSFNWIAPVSGEVNIYSAGQASTLGIFLMNSQNSGYSSSLVHLTPAEVAGIKDELVDKNASVIPNPANDRIRILLPKYSVKAEIEIIDTKGACVLKKMCEGGQREIEMGTLPDGIYTVIINSLNYSHSQKLVIKHP